MTRVPARPTLKLPVKTSPVEGGEAVSKGRKPVRSGFKAPKPTLAQRAKRHETIATRAAAQKTREAAEAARAIPKPAAEKPRAPARKPVEPAPRVDTKAAPASDELTTHHLPRRNKSVRDEAPKKVYPPRGIARSTGARAFPPARTDVAPAPAGEARRTPPSRHQSRSRPKKGRPFASAARSQSRPVRRQRLAARSRNRHASPSASASCSAARGARPTSGSRTAGCG